MEVARDARPVCCAGSCGTGSVLVIVVVAEILGHSVETARRYSLPTEQDKQRAIERLPVDQGPALPNVSSAQSTK
jgi:hypothetical protein